MNILEAMRERRSVRNFDGHNLSPQTVDALKKDVEAATSPFGGNVTIRLKAFDLRNGYKPSTYGMISGATDFFLLAIGKNEESALSAGFKFEQVVLNAWQKGLGTCWIAATFKGSDFDRDETWPDGEELLVICPVGVAAKKLFKEKLTRLALGSKNRKPFGSLFFNGDFNTPLTPDSRFGEALEMMRLAPSSTNSQPWRALVDGNKVMFYYKPKSRASVLDCGIGMRHFYNTETFYGRTGKFVKESTVPTPPDNWVYLRTYIAD